MKAPAGFEALLEQAPVSQRGFIREARGKIEVLKQMRDNPAWVRKEEKQGVTVMTYSDGGLNCIRGSGVMHYTPQGIFEAIESEEIAIECDGMLEKQVVLEELAMDTQFTYQKYKAPMFVSSRDFVMLNQMHKDPDGTIYVIAYSTTHSSMPVNKGVVRAELHIGGWILKPIGSNETQVDYISKSDLGGSLPKALLNSIAQKQGLKPILLQASMDKRKGTFK